MIGKRNVGAPSAKVVPQLMMPPVKVVPAASKTIVKGFDVSGENADLLRSPRTLSPSSERSSPDPSSRDYSIRKDIKKQQASGGSVIVSEMAERHILIKCNLIFRVRAVRRGVNRLRHRIQKTRLTYARSKKRSVTHSPCTRANERAARSNYI